MKEIIKSQFSNGKTRISEDAVDVMSKIVKVLTIEAAIRSAKFATAENKTTVTLSHVETILPQIVSVRVLISLKFIKFCIFSNTTIQEGN